MDKQYLLNEIERASVCIHSLVSVENKYNLKVFISELDRLKLRVIDGSLMVNPLRGFPRRYAEMYNDYLHPISDILYTIEKLGDEYLSGADGHR